MPRMVDSVVVFPMPLRPRRVTTSPAPTARSTPNSTRPSPYPASSPLTSSIRAAPLHRWMRCGPSAVFLAEIRAATLGVGANRRRSGGGDDTPVNHHCDPVGEREDRVHVVLDQHD